MHRPVCIKGVRIFPKIRRAGTSAVVHTELGANEARVTHFLNRNDLTGYVLPSASARILTLFSSEVKTAM